MFFASNDGSALGLSGINHNNQVSKINLKDVDRAMVLPGSDGVVNVNITKVSVVLPKHLLLRRRIFMSA